MQYAPVSGKVVEVNEVLGGQPGLINKSPEDEGTGSPARGPLWFTIYTSAWLCKIHLSNAEEVRSLVLRNETRLRPDPD